MFFLYLKSDSHLKETSSPKGSEPASHQNILNILQVNKRFFSIGQGQLTQHSMAKLIQDFIVVLVTCKNEEDPIDKDIILRFPIVSLWEMMTPGAWPFFWDSV